jgi:hypothetical protein
MVVTRTSNEIGETGPDESLSHLVGPLYGYNRDTIITQKNMLAIRDELNSTSVFKVPDYGTNTITSSGLLVLTLTYIVEDISTVPGLTTDNAYDLCMSTRQTEATALGIGEYQNWKTQYFNDKFITTSVVTTS